MVGETKAGIARGLREGGREVGRRWEEKTVEMRGVERRGERDVQPSREIKITF